MSSQMSPETHAAKLVSHEPWYKYGVAFLSLEMLMAAVVSAYSLLMTFRGLGGFPGQH